MKVCGYSVSLSLSTVAVAMFGLISSQTSQASEVDQLLDLSLKDLLHMEVTSASRREQSLMSAPAAIYVISHEEMKRKGIVHVADALRGVPGLEVASLDANKWIVSSRGFSSRYANKLLVQIDGRSVYTPSYSGVYWDMQDLLIDNIERIEVIRGPGATLWGANAVNGIINIITKNAADTQGWMIQAGAGNKTDSLVNLRVGDQLSENTFGRVYLKHQDTASNKRQGSEQSANDSWRSLSAGFRLDSQYDNRNNWTLQGDLFTSEVNQIFNTLWLPLPDVVATDVNDVADTEGANILGRWEHTGQSGTISTLQGYWDYAKRDELYIGQEHHTFDLDFQQQTRLNETHHLVWGLGYRHLESDYVSSFSLSIEDQSLDLYSGFIQDEITLKPDELTLTLGSKLEHNDFTGWEIQPSARLMWLASPGHSIWASVSRAVRTPSALEYSGQVVAGYMPPNPPFPGAYMLIKGSDQLSSERLMAYELGYRFHGSTRYSLDGSLFYNDYDDVFSYEVSLPDSVIDNRLEGSLYGIELSANWQVNTQWKLRASYSYLKASLRKEQGSTDISTAESIENASPENMFSIYSSAELSDRLSWDLWLNYTDSSRPSAAFKAEKVDDYYSLNTRLGWQINPQMEFAVTANNILDTRHQEYIGEFFSVPTEIERSVMATLKWDF